MQEIANTEIKYYVLARCAIQRIARKLCLAEFYEICHTEWCRWPNHALQILSHFVWDYGVLSPPNLPRWFMHRHYNSVCTTVWHC